MAAAVLALRALALFAAVALGGCMRPNMDYMIKVVAEGSQTGSEAEEGPVMLSQMRPISNDALVGSTRPEQLDSLVSVVAEQGETSLGAAGRHEVQNATVSKMGKMDMAAAEEQVIRSPNMLFFLASAVGVVMLALLNSCFKGMFVLTGERSRQEGVDLVKRLVLTSAVIVHTLICYAGTYNSHLHEDLIGALHDDLSVSQRLTPFTEFCTWVHGFWTEVIFFAAIAWVGASFVHEAYVVKRAPVQDQEIFTCIDIYSNAVESMFVVTIRFIFQSCLLLILVFVAEAGWKNPPQEVPLWRKVLNVVLALASQLYMVGQSKGRDSWQEMRRLRTVRALQLVPAIVSCDEDKDAPEVVQFTLGDYYVRLIMSVLANGLFHKFVLLSYPIFIFGYIGNADMLGIVKDILALVIVMEIDNLASPVNFRATSVVSS